MFIPGAAQFESLLAVLRALPIDEIRVQPLRAAASTCMLNFRRLSTSLSRRQELIEIQVTNEFFGGDVHDAYHEASAEVGSDLDNFFVSLKTFLNRLTGLIGALLTHEQRKGVRTGSFGTFINSLRSPATSKGNGLSRLLEGAEILELICDYRDKHVEHQASGELVSLGTADEKVTRVHYRVSTGNRLNQPHVPTHLEDDKAARQCLKLVSGEHYSYVVHVSSPLVDKTHVGKGEFMGTVSDGGSGHFALHGGHHHFFLSPDHPGNAMDAVSDVTHVAESPSPEAAYNAVLNYAARVLQDLSRSKSEP